MIASGFSGRGRFYAYPFLAAAMFLTFVMPQIPGLIGNYFLSDDSLARSVFFCVLCLAACQLGWSLGVRRGTGVGLVFDEDRLLKAAAALSIIGAYFFYKFGQLPDEERLRGFLTGATVAYLFFAKLLTYGLAIAVLCYARRASPLALGIIAFDCLFYFDRIVIAGRRGDAAEFGLIFALAFWFQRRWVVPKLAACAGLVAIVVALLGAEEYRQATYYGGQTQWSLVAQIDLAANWNALMEHGGPEVENLVRSMQHVSDSLVFDFGLSHWNDLVFTYVPAQLVGPEFKRSLMLTMPSLFDRGYIQAPGTTETGMRDAFASFWYFGFVKFMLVGLALGWIYAAAMRGNSAMQLLYMLSAMPSMLVVTHFTNEIVIAWVHMSAFLVPVALYAARWGRRPETVAASRPS
jgi:hypothetical protein